MTTIQRDEVRDEVVGNLVIELVARFPGYPVALWFDGSELHIGIIGLELGADDWFQAPQSVDVLVGAKVSESIELPRVNKNPRGKRVSKGDPGRTRTSNQLIKSQLR